MGEHTWTTRGVPVCGQLSQLHDHIWRAADRLQIQASILRLSRPTQTLRDINHNCLLCMLYMYTEFVKMASSSARITVLIK